ncbi:uncharacterized protein [Amphiura filiformis]|uniref:uncharacterized protein isoform X2 n=1 Tax=Amphiura filiformis TaxID=82378 RepID=UPI003B21D537
MQTASEDDMLVVSLSSQSSKASSIESLNHIEQQPSGPLPSVELNICNVFWRPNLACHPFEYGDTLVSFGELWPAEDRLAPLVSCFVGPEMQDAVVDCCILVLRCGPVRVLKQLLDQKIIGLDQTFEHGMTMLHIACLASNPEAVAFLISRGIDFKRSDKTGRTADIYCFTSKTRKALPARYHAGVRSLKKRPSSAHDKKTIFDLARNPACLEELQFKLHTMEFDVNHDRNARGDLLIHIAVKSGLSQLALLINLVKNHGANIEAHDMDGMTPLCLAAKYDMDIIAEMLICVLGADPNIYNHVNRWSPLHYAAKRNHLNIIDALSKRGADVNQEDNFATRPDDLAMHWGNDECCKLIDCLRKERCERLSYLAQKGNLKSNLVRYTDLFNADMEGKTLIMVAAEANRCDNLSVLLKNSKSPINAQHTKTGRTALTLATMKGHEVAVKTLLGFKALAGLRDMMSHVALQYACVEGHAHIVKDLVEDVTGLTGLFEALRCTRDEEIRGVLREAMERRQTQIVNPALFESAMDGDADRIFCIIEEGDDMNPQTGTGDWPMYMAAGNGHLEVMQLLYENGGDVSGRHPNTMSTVLHVACSRGLYKIVKYLLQFCKYGGYLGFFATTNLSCYQELDINSLNNHGQTALQVAASKGYSRIVKILLEHGASSAVLDLKGQLYKCKEFDGVQVLIERHRRTRTEQIMLCIKDRKRLGYLRRMWQAKFDHNLRNKNGDTPLMVACYYGRTEAVKFLLESAIQSMEDEERDFERSMQQWRRDSDDDSGTFEKSHSPTQIRRSLASLADMSTDMSTTDYSDQEFAERQEPYYTQRDHTERRESSAYHRRRRKKRAQFMMANASLDEGDEAVGGVEGGYNTYRPIPYVSDSEMFEDSYEGQPKGYGAYNPSLPSIRSGASLHPPPSGTHPSPSYKTALY